jgi:hypothetical protein
MKIPRTFITFCVIAFIGLKNAIAPGRKVSAIATCRLCSAA